MEPLASIIIGAVSGAIVLLLREGFRIYYDGRKVVDVIEGRSQKRQHTDMQKAVQMYQRYAESVEKKLLKVQEELSELHASYVSSKTDYMSCKIRLDAYIERYGPLPNDPPSHDHKPLGKPQP